MARWEAQDRNTTDTEWPVNDDEADDDAEPQRPRRRATTVRRAGRPENTDQQGRGRAGQTRRRVNAATEFIPAVTDSTQTLPPLDGLAERKGRRPRPRPRPAAPDARSTVYVSKHAADPG